MILVSTIWHTGTHSLVHAMPDFNDRLRDMKILWRHCNEDALTESFGPVCKMIITTYRNPYKVGAAWANRDHQFDRKWYIQWDIWAQLVPRAVVVPVDDLTQKLASYQDKNEAYQSLETDIERYHRMVPVKAIEHAQECVDSVKDRFHFSLETG